MTMHDVIGVSGMLLYVVAYAGLQCGLLAANGAAYCLLNLAAAAFVLTSLAVDFNLASALIQVMWILISLYGLARVPRLWGRASAEP